MDTHDDEYRAKLADFGRQLKRIHLRCRRAVAAQACQ